ncbi:rho GTPase-activating protein 30 isoform X2 [Heliangelus exortis]|uniref:rho GTPase-activating protein 30 isoform X2 n=1 Tax=Heliangelus exortis TaxID=472823 RepID=UPI003A8EB690
MALRSRHRARRKGGPGERVFGCDLLEHLQQTGQEVPQVLRSCTEFVEQHGVVDGIYRLSGVASNIQRLRQEFDNGRIPDLQRAPYLQDVHSVSSLCKGYCRELPNPLLTHQLYHRFADAVATQMEEVRLVKIKEVLKELPPPHYRTLEFLMRHLLRVAAHSHRTNMHARNLAIVWAPNLLRSKDIEAVGFNGTAAFMEVRVQSIVVEFILTHVEQLFGDVPLGGDTACPRHSLLLSPPGHVPATLSQGDGPPPIRPYHTIIELGEHRRKGSLKAKKWRSIFNLGRSSHEAKRKLQKEEEKGDSKAILRPAKSMDSLSSDPFHGDDHHPALSHTRSVKPLSPRRESLGTVPAPEQSPEQPPAGKEPAPDPETGSSDPTSEPPTPKTIRAPFIAPGRSPKACGSRAEKCGGVHISVPFSVTVPLHITSNLSRLTRALPCPALAQPPHSPPTPTRDPQQRTRGRGDTEQSRLSLELRDSFAFLDSHEPGLEGTGDGDMVALSLLQDTGLEDSEGSPGGEEGTENPGEPPMEQPPSYLSIEECMDEEMFFMAPGDPEDDDSDTDLDEMFLSAHDDLSPLETPDQPPGEGKAPPAPDPPGAHSPPVPQDTSPGDGDVPGGWGTAGTGEGGAESGSVRTDSGAGAVLEDEDGGAGSSAGVGAVPEASDGAVQEDGAGAGVPIPEEPEEGELQTAPESPPVPQESAEPLDPEGFPKEDPKVVPEVVPQVVPEMVPDMVLEVVPEVVLPPAASTEQPGAIVGNSPALPSLSFSAPDLHSASPATPEPIRADSPGHPGRPEPALRRDGSAAARTAARSVRVQQARSVPVVLPKPQFAKIPPALQPWVPPTPEGDPAAPPPVPEGIPEEVVGGELAAARRRAGWREGGSASFDAAVAVAVEQQAGRVAVRRIQTYGGEDSTPATPKALPFHWAPLRPRHPWHPRPLSCVAAPESEGKGGGQRSLSRAAGTEGAAGEL